MEDRRRKRSKNYVQDDPYCQQLAPVFSPLIRGRTPVNESAHCDAKDSLHKRNIPSESSAV